MYKKPPHLAALLESRFLRSRFLRSRFLRSRFLQGLLVLSLAPTGCSDDESVPVDRARPAHVVNEQKTHTSSYADVPIPMEIPTHFRTTDVLPELDIRRLLLANGKVFAGGASSVMSFDEAAGRFVPIALPGSDPVVDLAAMGDGRVVVARQSEVQFISAAGQPDATWTFSDASIQCLTGLGDRVWVGTSMGLAMADSTGLSFVGASGVSIRDLVSDGKTVWMATGSGLLRYDAANLLDLPNLSAPSHLPDNDVRALAMSSDGGAVVVGTASGIAKITLEGEALEKVTPGRDQLPTDDVLAIAEAGGATLVGHAIGATVLGPDTRDYYHTERWLPAERVNDVALQGDGTRWIATERGISRIAYEDRTLAERAELNEAQNATHWRMDGFVADSANWEDAWDRSGAVTHSDRDNDGLWTEMQVAAWCFAYASTGEERYYESARKAMDVIQLQFDVPAATFEAAGMRPGFITRSLVRSDEGEIFDNKAAQSNWHLQDFDGRTYYWKDDTSSDEYAGHFFGIPVFYDLCAKTEPEREALRQRVHAAVSYIIEHGYELIDLDGEPTLHGHWSNLAASVDGLNGCLSQGGSNCFESFGGGGWLNSIEVLGMLLSAWHITGDNRFHDEYERLTIAERYGEMIPVKETTATVTSRKVANHSDHELASLAYYTLLRYEPNADRREVWIQSIQDFYQYEKAERNPLEIAVMASAMEDTDAGAAAKTLGEMPLDWRNWPYDNSHRKDNQLDVLDRHGDEQFVYLFPYDEIRTMKWNGNPYAVVGGSSGQSVQAPWPYLLPYWMMRYYSAFK